MAAVERGALTDPIPIDRRTAPELALALLTAALHEHARAKPVAAEAGWLSGNHFCL